MLFLSLRKRVRNVAATIADAISFAGSTDNTYRNYRPRQTTRSSSVPCIAPSIRGNHSILRRTVTKSANNSRIKIVDTMGRRRKGRCDTANTEPTTTRRAISLTTLLSLFIAFVIVITLVAPRISHRRRLHELVYSLIHRGNNLDRNRQRLKDSSLKKSSVLISTTRTVRAVNASSLIPKPDARLKSYKRLSMSTNGNTRNNTASNVRVQKRVHSTSSRGSQRTVARALRGNQRPQAISDQNYRHSRARARRKDWWSFLHRRAHAQDYKIQSRGGGKVDQDKERTKDPSRLGRRNVVRDHIGRIVEPEIDGGSTADIDVKKTELDMSHKHPITKPSMKAVQEDKTDPKSKDDDDDEENAEAEEVEDGNDSTTPMNASAGKTRTVDRNEFTGSLGGTSDGMVRGQNVTKLSVTLFKIMKLFGFSSLTDSPAGAHAEWMGEVARRLSFEQPLFRYVGVDETANGLRKAKESVGDSVDGEFELHDIEHELGNPTDVLFHWTELDASPRDAHHPGYLMHVRKVLRTARRAGHGHVIFPQLPRLQGVTPSYRHGKWSFIDHKDEEPFLFNDHVRGAVPVGNGSRADVLYLTFYATRAIPAEQLDV